MYGATRLSIWAVDPPPLSPTASGCGDNDHHVVSKFDRDDGLFAMVMGFSDNTFWTSSSSGASKKSSTPSELFPYVRRTSLLRGTDLPVLALWD